MNSRITKGFRKQYDHLPEAVQSQAKAAYRLWQDNPSHRGLQFKRVSLRQPIYSVRIGIGWRALGLLEHNTVYWFWIGAHDAYDELLKRL